MASEFLRIKFDQCGHQDSLRHYSYDVRSLLDESIHISFASLFIASVRMYVPSSASSSSSPTRPTSGGGGGGRPRGCRFFPLLD